jgi:hypothetical protein
MPRSCFDTSARTGRTQHLPERKPASGPLFGGIDALGNYDASYNKSSTDQEVIKMKINCLCCGHKVDLGDSYDDYEGQVTCYVCHETLDIKSKDGKLRFVHLFGGAPNPTLQEYRLTE